MKGLQKFLDIELLISVGGLASVFRYPVSYFFLTYVTTVATVLGCLIPDLSRRILEKMHRFFVILPPGYSLLHIPSFPNNPTYYIPSGRETRLSTWNDVISSPYLKTNALALTFLYLVIERTTHMDELFNLLTGREFLSLDHSLLFFFQHHIRHGDRSRIVQ